MDTNLYIFFFTTLSKQQAKGVNWPLNWLLLAFESFEKKNKNPFNVHTQGPFLFPTCSFLTKILRSSLFIQYSRVFYSASQINVHMYWEGTLCAAIMLLWGAMVFA